MKKIDCRAITDKNPLLIALKKASRSPWYIRIELMRHNKPTILDAQTIRFKRKKDAVAFMTLSAELIQTQNSIQNQIRRIKRKTLKWEYKK